MSSQQDQLRGYFVTGTDTGVGKTYVCQALLRHLRDRRIAAVGFKPVASGSELTAEGLRNADALSLQQESAGHVAYQNINPYAFVAPVAPHLAAEAQGVHIDLLHIMSMIKSVSAQCVVVEGVGGWCVPINAEETMADLAGLLALPVIMVVGMRLGCLNHALLTAAAIRAQGLQLAGWIANVIDPEFELLEQNIAALISRLDAPLLAQLPWDRDVSVQSAAARIVLPV